MIVIFKVDLYLIMKMLLKMQKIWAFKILDKKYELNEIVRGDSIFCATGITSSDVLMALK